MYLELGLAWLLLCQIKHSGSIPMQIHLTSRNYSYVTVSLQDLSLDLTSLGSWKMT